MLNSTELLIDHNLKDKLIRDKDLAFIYKGSDARRYGLVNKALKKGELIRICRGLYTLGEKYNSKKLSKLYLANQISPFSFVSLESALSFYQWIPERITQTTSITPVGRSKSFKTDFGRFLYYATPVNTAKTYSGVQTIQIDEHNILIATPLRALIDYVYLNKIKNADFNFLENSLRIEPENFDTITKKSIQELRAVYKSENVQTFLSNLLGELNE